MHRMQSGGWPYSEDGRDSSKAPSLRVAFLRTVCMYVCMYVCIPTCTCTFSCFFLLGGIKLCLGRLGVKLNFMVTQELLELFHGEVSQVEQTVSRMVSMKPSSSTLLKPTTSLCAGNSVCISPHKSN